jgi:hypothetical protein
MSGDKKVNFMSKPITVFITTLGKPEGSGKYSYKPFKTYPSPRSYIDINNPDSKCLFYAAELGRIYHDRAIIKELQKEGKVPSNELFTEKKWYALKKNSEKQGILALQLQQEVGIPELNAYGIEHLKLVKGIRN